MAKWADVVGMQRILASLILVLIPGLAAAEDLDFNPESYIAQGRESNVKDQKTGEVNMNAPAQNAPVSTSLPGFADTTWKMTFTEVKTKLKNLATAADTTQRVEILNEEKNKSILVRRNDVLYRYNFYKTPIEVVRINNHEIKEDEYNSKEGVLFHVKVTFTLIDSAKVMDRIEKSHGGKTKSTVSDKTMEGAEIWELTGGLVFQWIEPYRKMKFTRTVDFLSDEMAKEIMKENADYFDAKEKWIMKNILLY